MRYCGASLETEDSLNKGTAIGSSKKTAYLYRIENATATSLQILGISPTSALILSLHTLPTWHTDFYKTLYTLRLGLNRHCYIEILYTL